LDEQLQLGDSGPLVSLRKAWEQALNLLAPEINRPSFETFVKTARPVSIDGKNVVIGTTGELAKIFIEKYTHLVKAALESQLGSDLQITFTAAPREQAKPKSTVQRNAPKAAVLSSISLPLNDKYTFDNFVEGSGSRMAHAVAMAVAAKPGKAYNPVFLYGGPGLGKTHLLHAIGNYVLANHPDLRVAYVSGEQFTAHYVMALREHRSEDFRRKYRSIDIWLVDDIQFLVGKEKTNEEFFHTFNALYQTDKQIVLSSDRSPRSMQPIEERLKSRFESGVVMDIAPPDLETRIAILQRKALQEGVDIPPHIIECIAEVVRTNVRALEGALVTLLAFTSLMKVPFSEPLVNEVLGRYLSEQKRTELSPDAVQRAVAAAFDLDVSVLCGDKRTKGLVTARHIAIYLSRELTDASLPAIGKAFGGRNHSTVLHACTHAKELLEQDGHLKSVVDQLEADLKSGMGC
jgi:chromosomal replication initiator protein